MLRTLRTSVLSASLLAAAPGLVGCDPGSPPPAAPNPAFKDLGTQTTSLEGYAFDPEAFFLTVMACGDSCEAPPFVSQFYPLLPYAVVGGAQVFAFDPVSQQTVGAPGTSEGMQATWRVTPVPAREDAPYFLQATGGSLPAEVASEMPLPPVPPAEFVPTLSLYPIPTHLSTVCVGQEANLMSKTGALDAVARYLTANGEPTTVDDLLNPARFGGVVVNWLFSPGGEYGPSLRVPAFGFGVVAEPGRVLPIEWVPAEAELPPEAAALRSERGFMVGDPSMPVSGIGMSVVLLEAGDAGKAIQVTAALPPGESEEAPPPFEPVVREVVARPGVVSYLPVQLRQTGEPPSWAAGTPMLCHPE